MQEYSQSTDKMSSDKNTDLQEAKQNDVDTPTDKELEIENGFFTVDDDADQASGKDLHDEKNIHTENKEADALPTPVKDENEKYTETNPDTIDAVFNSVLGITKGNNLSAVHNAGIPDETTEEESDETSENDDIK